MASVPLDPHPRSRVARVLLSYARRRHGDLQPAAAAANHSGVLIANGLLETAVEKRWHVLDPHLKWLAVQASASAIGCSWCTDYGYYLGSQDGIEVRKMRDVPRWRDSDAYDDRERLVLEYAERATATPADVDDDLSDRLAEHFSVEERVELAAWVALESYRSRFNAGLGLMSQGFSASCSLA
ncbi:MAG: carboxymuconolactone decarboxylase family protein [Microbacterium sp.]|uniref:carboxymuconolactone decarboxylase family protein n=1 Tax=Microbacterium sp. TaxID=51671 RepID=UPI001D33CD43|nr:carboxymuconolactone decarboxylase family protein [Microbacterium sp.]MBW8764634.1 carboxymuconolactone decarboxylase family protein [Microbacterium sp.]